MRSLMDALFATAPEIRYVATYLDGVHLSAQRPDLEGASSAESDKYEELIVNPTLLKLVTQRGNIDCGGAEWVLIRYGNFFELVVPVPQGHISVGIGLDGNPLSISEQVLSLVFKAI